MNLFTGSNLFYEGIVLFILYFGAWIYGSAPAVRFLGDFLTQRLAIYITAVLAIASIPYVTAVVVFLFDLIENHPFLTTILSITIAFLFYGLRENQPFIYGSLEMYVGVSAIYYAITSNNPERHTSTLIALSSGIYIIVRSLDNMSKKAPLSLVNVIVIIRWGKNLK